MIHPSPGPRSIASLYLSTYHRCYAASKLQTDPLYGSVASVLLDHPDPPPLLDVGCGIGILAAYLRESGYAAPILGLDFDSSKIAAAQRVAERYPGVEFHVADARQGLPSFSGSVAILDILQYLPDSQQQSLVREAASRISPRGCFLLRSGLREPGWRYHVTRAADHFAKLAFWMKSAPVTYPERQTLSAWLHDAGLSGDVRPLYGRTPFNNYLFAFRRQAPREQGSPGMKGSPI